MAAWSETEMKKKSPDSELLREGYKSYHKAVFAVIEFRREAGKTIQTAVEKRAPELAASMKLDKNEFLAGISPYTKPDRLTQEYDGSSAQIGIKIPKRWNFQWEISFYFWIDDDQSQVCAYIFLKNPGPAFEKLPVSCECDEHAAWISEIVPSDGSRDLATVCNRVLDRWIEVWKKVGGLRQFLPKKV
jgi:hypothetical protein